jgi:hypothetical protein
MPILLKRFIKYDKSIGEIIMLVYFFIPKLYTCFHNYGVHKRRRMLQMEVFGTIYIILGSHSNPNINLYELPHKMNKSQVHSYIIESIYKI